MYLDLLSLDNQSVDPGIVRQDVCEFIDDIKHQRRDLLLFHQKPGLRAQLLDLLTQAPAYLGFAGRQFDPGFERMDHLDLVHQGQRDCCQQQHQRQYPQCEIEMARCIRSALTSFLRKQVDGV